MKIFVINLARSIERRASIEKQLSSLNLDYEIIEAVDGSQLSYEEILQKTRVLNYAIGCGEIGCALSHINIYKKIVAQNIPQALILEDDALISLETVEVMNKLEILNISLPTVTLLTEISQRLRAPLYNTKGEKHSLHKVLEATCSHGYVVNHRAAVQLANFLFPVWMVADRWHILREYSVCNLQAVVPPVIFRTEHAETSTIQISDRSHAWMVQKKNYIWETIKRRRPLKVKLKRLIWTSFVYPFLKIMK
ncbi:glycosyltransferase family 25 protein [Rahnella aquatilis]|nr:glycosyltransferase family 25 protein [Rahnella aquatilis]